MMDLSEFSKIGINIGSHTSGQIKVKCPECERRTNKQPREKDLSVNIDSGIYQCWVVGCGFKGTISKSVKSNYVIPEWRNRTGLPNDVVDYFRGRKISQETISSMMIGYEKEHFFPALQKKTSAVCYHYIMDGILKNIKFRSISEKAHMMNKGSELIFYNIDSLKDNDIAIVTEGEEDCISWIEACFSGGVVSVPNGATMAATPNLSYVDACINKFKHIKTIYIATDDDEPGNLLAKELSRRFGKKRCKRITFGGCKDSNEFLKYNGKEELLLLLDKAQSFPVPGISSLREIEHKVRDIFDNGFKRGSTIGFDEFDEHICWVPGFVSVWTGMPNHGKSEFVDFIMVLLSIKHGWKWAIYSAENPPEIHVTKLAEKIIGLPFTGNDKMNEAQYAKAMEWINAHFFFIDMEFSEDEDKEDQDHTITNILAKAEDLVEMYGVRGLIIDNYASIEEDNSGKLTETQLIKRIMKKLKRFSLKHDVHTALVAHPTKVPKDRSTGIYEVVTQYMISGSAHFFNLEDVGMSIYLDYSKPEKERTTSTYIQKRRFKHWGKLGKVDWMWNPVNGRYSIATDYNGVPNYKHDMSNWLDKSSQKSINFQELEEYDDLPF